MKSGLRGSAVIDVIIGAAILVLVILPLFSAIIERYILLNKMEIIRDAVDITNIAVYNSLSTSGLGKKSVSFDLAKAKAIYKELLATNLKLDSDLKPASDSIADDTVIIDQIGLYTSILPAVCPLGNTIMKPSVHCLLIVPVKPTLYRQAILDLTGSSNIALKIHVDSEIPLND